MGEGDQRLSIALVIGGGFLFVTSLVVSWFIGSWSLFGAVSFIIFAWVMIICLVYVIWFAAGWAVRRLNGEVSKYGRRTRGRLDEWD